jgi:chromate transporter
MAQDAPVPASQRSALDVFLAFLKLGLTSFGGPIAHLGYFRDEFVARRKWLDEATYADIVALCQFLPGPASSQVGIAIGMLRAGQAGGFLAWLGFTAPSALAMVLFGYGVTAFGDLGHAQWLHGLKIVAVAVVAQAVWGMAQNLCPDRARITLAVGACVLTLFLPSSIGQVGVIALGALIGWRFLPAEAAKSNGTMRVALSRRTGIVAFAAFVVLLVGLPLAADTGAGHTLQLVDAFYRAGALVFGGGHVVLPLLQQQVVPPGWISNDAFLAGYGAAQAVPGPLFTFAAYLGTAMQPSPHGVIGALICLCAIFLPSFLLLFAALPFWDDLRRRTAIQSALKGINAAVVGLLLAALYTPVWTSAIAAPVDFAVAAVAFVLLVFWKTPPWLVVLLGALARAGMAVLT